MLQYLFTLSSQSSLRSSLCESRGYWPSFDLTWLRSRSEVSSTMGQAVLLYNLQPWKVKDSLKVKGHLYHETGSVLYNLQHWKVKDSHKVRGQLLHGTDSVTVQPPALKGQRLHNILSEVKFQKSMTIPLRDNLCCSTTSGRESSNMKTVS